MPLQRNETPCEIVPGKKRNGPSKTRRVRREEIIGRANRAGGGQDEFFEASVTAKRIFDMVFSATGLLLTAPFFLFIAWRIKREDGGPVFFLGKRVGRRGHMFRIFKFRTMVVNAESIGGPSTADDDPRITTTGRRLRKYKLDELPQLINVVRGDMSIVGPRPEVKQYTDLFDEEEKQILSVRPGITDWASIWNSDEGAVLACAEEPEKTYMELIRPTKLKLQLKYVKEKSLWVDLKIIYLTVLAVLRPESQAVLDIRKLKVMDVHNER